MRFAATASCACVLLAASLSSAQSLSPDTIEDQPIGWMRLQTFTQPPVPVTVDARQYPAAQLQIAKRSITWMQATYVPMGGPGDIVESVSEKLGPYNQNTAALPQRYGALARIYTDLKHDDSRTIVRASNSHIVWSVMANGHFGEACDALSTPEHYYFTLPSFVQRTFGGEELEKADDLSRHPVLGRFPSWYPRNSVNGNRKFIVLSKDNRSPCATVTKGEYPSGLRLRVYTVAPAVVAAASTDAPQWIAVSWTAELHDPVIRHLHEAVVDHFDFQYIQDYVFKPERVKGRPYAPIE